MLISTQFILFFSLNKPVTRIVSPLSWPVFAETGSFAEGQMHPVWLCRRLVNDWRVQLLLPGVEHYSIWLPQKGLHRGTTADGLGYPLHWVDEAFLSTNAGAKERLANGLSCQPIPDVDAICVEGEMTRRNDEGLYSLNNHCQHTAVEVLELCGGEVPPLLPKLRPYF